MPFLELTLTLLISEVAVEMALRTWMCSPLLALSCFASAASAQLLVPGSDTSDFSVICKVDGKETFSIVDNHKNLDYRVARNIFLTDMGGGRVAISLVHGMVNATMPATYLTAANESCQTFSQR